MTAEDEPDPEAVAPRVAPVLRRAQRAAPAPVVFGLPAAYGGLLGDVASLADVPEPASLASVAPRPVPAPPPLTPRPAEGWLAPSDARGAQEDEDPRPTVVPLPSAPAISPGSTQRQRRVVQERPPLIAMTALGFFGLFVASVIGAGLWVVLHAERHATASPLSPITVTELPAAATTPAEPAADPAAGAADPTADPAADPTADPAADPTADPTADPASGDATAEEETGTAPATVARTPPRRTAAPSRPKPAEEDPWAIPAEGTVNTPIPAEPEKKKGLFGRKNK